MAYKLVVSNTVEFDIRFALNDGGKERKFGVRVRGLREPQETISKEFADDISIGEFLSARELVPVAWVGECPFVDEATGRAPDAGPEAWEALLGLPGFVGLAYRDYLAANGAKGKAGN